MKNSLGEVSYFFFIPVLNTTRCMFYICVHFVNKNMQRRRPYDHSGTCQRVRVTPDAAFELFVRPNVNPTSTECQHSSRESPPRLVMSRCTFTSAEPRQRSPEILC